MDGKTSIDLNYFKSLRREFHRIPELGYREYKTSDKISQELDSYGIEYERGIGKTGIVAWIKKGNSKHSIALRADMDALEIPDESGVKYISEHNGISHACGHDGHTVMLLAAAKALKSDIEFDGTVYLIFQPAEEGGAGAKRMIDDGLFEKFKIDSIYGMHNRPQEPFGTFLIKEGPVMTSVDTWSVLVKGRSGHSSQPHRTINPIIVAAHTVQAIKEISALSIDPSEAHVITVSGIYGGGVFNAVPDTCRIEGSIRSFSNKVQNIIEERINTLSKSIANGFGAEAEVHYEYRYPPTINTKIDSALGAAKMTVGVENIKSDFSSSMGSEDFSYFLQQVQGCYVWLGSATDENSVTPLHSSKYDFNDDLIEIGANYWINLVKRELS